MGGEAQALHERDGEDAGSHDVRRRAAADGSHEAAAHYRRLGRTAPERTGEPDGQVDEHASAPRDLERSREEHEIEHHLHAHTQRNAQQALDAQDLELDKLGQLDEAVPQGARNKMTQKIISQRHDGHRGDAPAEITPRGLYGQEDINKAQVDIAHGNVVHVADTLVQEVPLKQIEQRDAHGDDGQDVIDHPDAAFLAERFGEKDDAQRETQMKRSGGKDVKHPEKGPVKLDDRPDDGQHGDRVQEPLHGNPVPLVRRFREQKPDAFKSVSHEK